MSLLKFSKNELDRFKYPKNETSKQFIPRDATSIPNGSLIPEK